MRILHAWRAGQWRAHQQQSRQRRDEVRMTYHAILYHGVPVDQRRHLAGLLLPLLMASIIPS